MSYAGYVVAAYTVFAVVMLWDALAPQWQIARALRTARLRARRDAARRAGAVPAPGAPVTDATRTSSSDTTP